MAIQILKIWGLSAISDLTGSEFQQFGDIERPILQQLIKSQHHRAKRGRVIDNLANFTGSFMWMEGDTPILHVNIQSCVDRTTSNVEGTWHSQDIF